MASLFRDGCALAGAAVIALGLGALAYAESPSAPPPPGAAASPPPGAHPFRQRMRERMQERAKLVHDALNLRPSQEGAWEAMAAALKPQPGDRGLWGARMNPPAGHAMTMPERLDRMADMMAARQAQFAKRADAIKAFYAQLDLAQQKTFDSVTLLSGGGFGMMRGPGVGHHRGPGAHRGRGHGMGHRGMAPPPAAADGTSTAGGG